VAGFILTIFLKPPKVFCLSEEGKTGIGATRPG
jgi:hypothetical protein